MDTETSTGTAAVPAPIAPLINGMTKEQFARALERLRERNKDPEVRARREQAFAEAEEYRRQVNEEARRWLDEEEGK